MTRRSTLAVLLALVTLTIASGSARAQGAPPPIGHWVGTFHDGSTVELTVQADGTCLYGIPGAPPVVGSASWNPSSAGGILTLTYWNAGQATRAYFSVVWVNQTSFVLSDPYFKVLMRRK